jgi:CheY-like chemotaxis protein
MQTDELTFVDEQAETDPSGQADRPWKVLIVDDERDVHQSTGFAFLGVKFEGRLIAFESAFSGQEALQMVLSNRAELPDLVLMDVVMQTPTDGLDTVRQLRRELAQRNIPFIILRTGQAGNLLNHDALGQDQDIDLVVNKSELTAEKLRSAVFAGLRTVRTRNG